MAKTIDIAFVMKRNDEDGNPLMGRDENGNPVAQPVLFTQNFNVPEGYEVRCSFWDVDDTRLTPLTAPGQSAEESRQFMSLSLERMAEIDRSGALRNALNEQKLRLQLADLQARLDGNTPASNET